MWNLRSRLPPLQVSVHVCSTRGRRGGVSEASRYCEIEKKYCGCCIYLFIWCWAIHLCSIYPKGQRVLLHCFLWMQAKLPPWVVAQCCKSSRGTCTALCRRFQCESGVTGGDDAADSPHCVSVYEDWQVKPAPVHMGGGRRIKTHTSYAHKAHTPYTHRHAKGGRLRRTCVSHRP